MDQVEKKQEKEEEIKNDPDPDPDPDPIDLVFTWVQPDDLKCKLEREMFQAMYNIRKKDNSINPRRLPPSETDHTNTELYHAIHCALKNLPWVRKIFLVLHNDQEFRIKKDKEKKTDKIQIVYHRDIFPNPLMELPTFNSHAIESCIHNIPGLAERFIYFNDDCYIVKPIPNPSFFFSPFGTARFFHDSYTVRRSTREPLPTNFATHYICCIRNHQLLDEKFGFQHKRKKPWHQPLPLTKTLCRQAESFFPTQWQQTRESKFRSLKNIVPLYLALQLGLALGQISCSPFNASSISLWRSCPTTLQDWERLKSLIIHGSSFPLSLFQKSAYSFVCINDMSDTTPLAVRHSIFSFFKKISFVEN